MMARISTILSLTLTVLSLGAHAASVPSDGKHSPLQARDGTSCCWLAQDSRLIQITCQYMYENCGGWSNCLKGQPNDQSWCSYCVVTHPEDPACLTLTWPPAYPAPIHKRDPKDATILPPPEHAKDDVEAAAPVSKRSSDAAPDSEDVDTASNHLDKRAWSNQDILTHDYKNRAQSYERNIGLVTIRIIISALGVVTWSVQNAGANEVVFHVIDMLTNWTVQGTCPAGETRGGSAPNQIMAKGGDGFKVGIQH